MDIDVLSKAFASEHDDRDGFRGPAEIDIRRHPELLAVVTDCLAKLSDAYGCLVIRDDEVAEGWGQEGGPDTPFERLGIAKPQDLTLSAPTGPLILGDFCHAVDGLLLKLKDAPKGSEEQKLIYTILEWRRAFGNALKETFSEFFKERVDLISGEPVQVTVEFSYDTFKRRTTIKSVSFPDGATPVMVDGERETSLADVPIHIQNASALIKAFNKQGLARTRLEVGMIFKGYQTIYGVKSICLEVPESELSRLSTPAVLHVSRSW